ncbi:AraC family transcriptional regulator [Paenibacillus sp. JTLBN-2024]
MLVFPSRIRSRSGGEDLRHIRKGFSSSCRTECESLIGVSVSFGISGNLSGCWETVSGQYNTLLGVLRSRAALGQNLIVIDIEHAGSEPEAMDDPGLLKQEDMKSWVIGQIQNYIQANLSGDVSLTAIAEKVHFNPSYLSRYYKQMTGQNLLDYIQSKKLEAAVHLMMHTNLKLNEIAARVGFDSQSYFLRPFSKKTGISPKNTAMPNESPIIGFAAIVFKKVK